MSIFERIAQDTDPDILLPNRYSEGLHMWFVRCPCGASPGQRDGELSTHFPRMYEGHAPRIRDPFYPGTGVCRYSGRAVTLAAALDRDSQLTPAERRVKMLATAREAAQS